MNFLTMEYFVMLAREKNFTRAADKLHITQQTLSAHIAALEKETSCKLFVRQVPLKLTYAGQIFLRYAQDFCKKNRSLKQELNDVAEEETGELRLGMSPTREKILLPQLIADFQKRHPYIFFNLTEASNLRLQQKLLAGEIDLAIAHFPETLAGLEQKYYYREEIVLLAGKKLLASLYHSQLPQILKVMEQRQPNCLQILETCPFLLNNGTNITGHVARRLLAQAGFTPTVKVVSDNMETLLRLCTLGIGAMFCPDNLARNILTKAELAQLVIFSLPQASHQISFGLRKEPHRWSVLQQFVDEALTRAPAKS